jgi:hypothetical protein
MHTVNQNTPTQPKFLPVVRALVAQPGGRADRELTHWRLA